MKVFLYRRGFARFTNSRYSSGRKIKIRLNCISDLTHPFKIIVFDNASVFQMSFKRLVLIFNFSDVQDIYNGFVHLTNVAIQKTAENYDERTGGKMELQSLKLFLMSRYGVERVDALFWEIQMIVLRSLLAVQHVMINDKHCFELYGMYMN